MPSPATTREANSNRNRTAAQALLDERDNVERASEKIARDPEEAQAILAPHVQAAPNVGEITVADMFGLFTQMQAQMGRMQEQMVTLMTGQGPNQRASADTAKELAQDKAQRDATLEAWRTEPREPVQVNPDQDEERIFAVTNQYPPRLFRVNGLEFPVQVGTVVMVPTSIAALIRYNQRQRPMQRAPQPLGQIPDPAQGRFLLGGESISPGPTLHGVGKAGEGRLPPPMVPPHPQELGVQYDHQGQ